MQWQFLLWYVLMDPYWKKNRFPTWNDIKLEILPLDFSYYSNEYYDIFKSLWFCCYSIHRIQIITSTNHEFNLANKVNWTILIGTIEWTYWMWERESNLNLYVSWVQSSHETRIQINYRRCDDLFSSFVFKNFIFELIVFELAKRNVRFFILQFCAKHFPIWIRLKKKTVSKKCPWLNQKRLKIFYSFTKWCN